MKTKVQRTILAWAVILAVCLIFPIAGRAAVEGKACTPEPTDVFISYGDLITCSINVVGDNDSFRFYGTFGERVKIEASSASTYPCIELRGPDGTVIATACGSYAVRNWIDTVLPKQGTVKYTIRVFDFLSNGTGPYTLALESLVPPSPTARQTTYGKNLSDEINPADDLDEFFFTGKVGNDVHITAASGSTYPCIELVGPDKKTAGAACGSYATRNEVDKVLTIAGTYTVLVYDFLSNGAGAYTLDLECLSVPCPPALIPAVSGYAKLRGSPLVNCKVCLFQTGAVTQCVRTDNKGYYQFNKIVVGEIYHVTIYGPVVPAAFGTPPSADTADEGLLE